jgi:multidrug efflux pump subunit AcrA (membrane-fusion protein)
MLGPLPVLAALCVLLAAGCTAKAPEEAAAPPPATDRDIVVLSTEAVQAGRVQWHAAKRSSIPEVLQVTGRIVVNENRTSRVGAIADGRVAEVFANVGDRVAKGQRIALLVSHEVHDARAEYAKARAEFRRRESELEFASNAAKRAARLYELKAASLEQVQRSEADLRGAELAVSIAQAEVNRVAERITHLGLTTKGAEEEYSKAVESGEFEEEELVPITAPLAGTVLSRFVSPGTVVTPSSDLMIISDLGVLWVNAEVPEKYLSSLRAGRAVDITVRAYGSLAFPGRVAHIGDVLNPATRTVEVRCEAQNREGKLKPEMYATVIFELGEVADVLLIPLAAVQDVDGRTTVFVRETETRFRARQIKIGRQTASEAEILEGLSPGDVVATAGSFLLKSELLNRQVAQE